MRFDSEFETLIGWIECHMTLFWSILDNKTSRTMTNHDETMTVKHHEPWRTMTKPWQRNITNHDVNHDELWRNHDSKTLRTMTKPWRNHDRETSWTMMWTMTNHDEPWRNHDSKISRTMTKPWQRNITNHHMNHDEPWRNITKHHEPWRTITPVATETSGRQHLF